MIRIKPSMNSHLTISDCGCLLVFQEPFYVHSLDQLPINEYGHFNLLILNNEMKSS